MVSVSDWVLNLYPNLINRNYNEKSFIRNDYEVDDNVEYIIMHIPKKGGNGSCK